MMASKETGNAEIPLGNIYKEHFGYYLIRVSVFVSFKMRLIFGDKTGQNGIFTLLEPSRGTFISQKSFLEPSFYHAYLWEYYRRIFLKTDYVVQHIITVRRFHRSPSVDRHYRHSNRQRTQIPASITIPVSSSLSNYHGLIEGSSFSTVF